MPIKVVQDLPALQKLTQENIFVMDERRATMQDFRTLEVVIVNLMPTKEATEEQLLRLLSNSPLQVNVTFIHMQSHQAAHISENHLKEFYRTFDQIKDRYFDGMIITGAPVEHLDFEEVNYWDELVSIMEWSNNHVFSTLHICWGAQAALYHHYGIGKQPLDKKLFGIYEQELRDKKVSLVRGMDELFYMPHSRHTTVPTESFEQALDLEILAGSEETGVSIAQSTDSRFVFIFGHAEYDAETLGKEYKRDVEAGKPIELPVNYYPGNNPEKTPKLKWRTAANTIYANWLNYYVYQVTPFVIEQISDSWQGKKNA
ncbi:homoserine O-acetyltransferase MetA [Aerococcus viridans]|uniref:Homoserine O-acetyltransferase n=1 Tax=Aerococcus viridans TaxID=1377 RepID=A0A2J9PL29_9LACT|nr:homoserine O-succinyltransferase [Aerococcus viridans]PNL91007.1 homoserine O-succinyltransferase [Aerococcus viridans]